MYIINIHRTHTYIMQTKTFILDAIDCLTALIYIHTINILIMLCPCNPPGPHCHTRRSGSRTRDSGAGGRRSNKERQRLQPLASVARAPLFEVRRVRFYTQPLLA